MAPPAKRPKLSNSSKSSPAKQRGLDYFFSKQKGGSPAKSSQNHQDAQAEDTTTELTDEQLARKLQAQWDEEDAGSSTVAVPRQDDIGSPLVASEQLNNDAPITNSDNAEQRQDSKADEGPSTVSMVTNHFAGKGSSSSNPALKARNNLALQSGVSGEDSISSGICFDESPLTFDPHKYLPDLQKQWATHGGNASYALVIRCFVLVNSTQSRIKIVDTLVNLLRTIIEGDPSSLLPTVCISSITSRLRRLSPIHGVMYCSPYSGPISIFNITFSVEPVLTSSRYGLPQMQYPHHIYLLNLVWVVQLYPRR
jgi:DNA ligase-1